jgi:hypothetical protein
MPKQKKNKPKSGKASGSHSGKAEGNHGDELACLFLREAAENLADDSLLYPMYDSALAAIAAQRGEAQKEFTALRNELKRRTVIVDKVMETGCADVRQALQFLHGAWKDSQAFHMQSNEILMNLHHNEIQTLMTTIVQIEQRQQAGLKISLQAVDDAMLFINKRLDNVDGRVNQIQVKAIDKETELASARTRFDSKPHFTGTPVCGHQHSGGKDEDFRQGRAVSTASQLSNRAASEEQLQNCLNIANAATNRVVRSSSREERRCATERLQVAQRDMVGAAMKVSAMNKRSDPNMCTLLECNVGEEVLQSHGPRPWLSTAIIPPYPQVINQRDFTEDVLSHTQHGPLPDYVCSQLKSTLMPQHSPMLSQVVVPIIGTIYS